MTILQQADEIINGDRANDYGSVTENFSRIAVRWSQHFGVEVTAQQVGLCLIELKLARLVNSPEHRDSIMDVAGYVGCLDKLSKGE